MTTSTCIFIHTFRFLSPANQRVTDTLIDTVYNDTGAIYTAKDIKRAIHRYYESRRRLGIEEMPDRQVSPRVCGEVQVSLCVCVCRRKLPNRGRSESIVHGSRELTTGAEN